MVSFLRYFAFDIGIIKHGTYVKIIGILEYYTRAITRMVFTMSYT